MKNLKQQKNCSEHNGKLYDDLKRINISIVFDKSSSRNVSSTARSNVLPDTGSLTRLPKADYSFEKSSCFCPSREENFRLISITWTIQVTFLFWAQSKFALPPKTQLQASVTTICQSASYARDCIFGQRNFINLKQRVVKIQWIEVWFFPYTGIMMLFLTWARLSEDLLKYSKIFYLSFIDQ